MIRAGGPSVSHDQADSRLSLSAVLALVRAGGPSVSHDQADSRLSLSMFSVFRCSVLVLTW